MRNTYRWKLLNSGYRAFVHAQTNFCKTTSNEFAGAKRGGTDDRGVNLYPTRGLHGWRITAQGFRYDARKLSTSFKRQDKPHLLMIS